MASLARFSSSGRSEEEPFPRLEVKSAWVNDGLGAPDSKISAVEPEFQPSLHEQSPLFVRTSMSSTSAAQAIELKNFPSTPTKAELETDYGPRAQLPSVVHTNEPPAESQVRENGFVLSNVPVGGAGGGTVAAADADEERPLSVWRKLFYAMGAIPFTLTQAAMGFYFTVFLLEVVKVRAQQAKHELPQGADSSQ